MVRGGRLRGTVACFALVAMIAAALCVASPAAAATCPATWSGISPKGLSANPSLTDVYAVSRTNAWAVGTYENSTESAFAIHWNGTSWASVKLPLPTNVSDTGLNAVSGSSATDVWAAGFSDLNGVTSALLFHWNGTAWSRAPLPTPSNITLYDVAASGPSDAWAVGERIASNGYSAGPAAYHWNGTAWTMTNPAQPMNNTLPLFGVADLGAGDSFALAQYGDPLYQWATSSWSYHLPVNDGHDGDAFLARSDADVLVVGEFAQNPGSGFEYAPSVLEWNGSTWTELDNAVNPNALATQTVTLQDIASDPSTGIWSVGFWDDGNNYLAEEYDGSTWTLAEPASTVLNSTLAAVSASKGVVVAVGANGTGQRAFEICPVSVTDASLGSGTVGFGQTAYFVADQTDSQSQTIQDDTTMGLFTSPSLSPGSLFGFKFQAAGTYPIADTTNSTTATVSVPITSSRSTGTLSTSFTLHWALQPAPTGFVYDVAIKRPGVRAFRLWKTGATVASASFKADKGTGSYQFEARLRKLSGGETSFSPRVALKVT